MSLTNIGIQAYYQGRSYTLDLTGWEYGYNCILTGLTEFVADFILSKSLVILGQMVNLMPRRKGVMISTCIIIAFGLVFLSKTIVENHTLQMVFFAINCIVGSKFIFTKPFCLQQFFYTHHSLFPVRYQQQVLGQQTPPVKLVSSLHRLQ